MKKNYTLFFILLLMYTSSYAQIMKIMDFHSANGVNPSGGLVVGDKIYGTTTIGGAKNKGTIFSINTDGSEYKVIFSFNDTTGRSPNGSLLLLGSKLYGTTFFGGINDLGTVFSINTDGTGFRTLVNFDGLNGSTPYSSLAISNGIIYGNTHEGGISYTTPKSGYGVIFSINPDGSNFKKLKDFDGTSGSMKPTSALTVSDTKIYGVASNCLFSLNIDGSDFKCLSTEGAFASGQLILSEDVLYGVTADGGAEGNGYIFSIHTDGTMPKNLHDFTTAAIDGVPYSLAPRNLSLFGNVLVGAAQSKGQYGFGSLFSINTDGSNFKYIAQFDGTNGSVPNGYLKQIGNDYYGTTTFGGSTDEGVLFSLSSIVTGVNDPNTTDSQINAYPNPSIGIFDVSYSVTGVNDLSLNIKNSAGQTVYTDNVNQATGTYRKTIDLSGQPKGAYFIEINCGGVSTLKIVLQ